MILKLEIGISKNSQNVLHVLGALFQRQQSQLEANDRALLRTRVFPQDFS